MFDRKPEKRPNKRVLSSQASLSIRIDDQGGVLRGIRFSRSSAFVILDTKFIYERTFQPPKIVLGDGITFELMSEV